MWICHMTGVSKADQMPTTRPVPERAFSQTGVGDHPIDRGLRSNGTILSDGGRNADCLASWTETLKLALQIKDLLVAWVIKNMR